MVLSDPAPTYLGLVSGGGYSSEATSVNISTPCLGGLINNPNLCFSGLEAVMAWNITADNWLINNQLNTVGTLGLGIQSPFWTTTNQTYVTLESGLTYSFSIG